MSQVREGDGKGRTIWTCISGSIVSDGLGIFTSKNSRVGTTGSSGFPGILGCGAIGAEGGAVDARSVLRVDAVAFKTELAACFTVSTSDGFSLVLWETLAPQNLLDTLKHTSE